MGEINSQWEREEGVVCVSCPDCAFTFDAVHTNDDGSYLCPVCGELALAARVEELDRLLKSARAISTDRKEMLDAERLRNKKLTEALQYIAAGSPWKTKLESDSIVVEYEEVSRAALAAAEPTSPSIGQVSGVLPTVDERQPVTKTYRLETNQEINLTSPPLNLEWADEQIRNGMTVYWDFGSEEWGTR